MLYIIVTYIFRYAMQNNFSVGKGKTQLYTNWVK
jgi:hypothetical protein